MIVSLSWCVLNKACYENKATKDTTTLLTFVDLSSCQAFIQKDNDFMLQMKSFCTGCEEYKVDILYTLTKTNIISGYILTYGGALLFFLFIY